MTLEQRQASIRRHIRFLTSVQQATFGETEAEKRAFDRMRNDQKNNGALDRLEVFLARRIELREARA